MDVNAGGEPLEAGRVTIAQVAALAGVSATTVSHALTGKRRVGATTHARVHEAVRQLGYRPNIVARNLRTRRSHMVAAIVPDITNPYYGVLVRGLADAVDDEGYGTYVCNTDASAQREGAFINDALDRGVDGVVIASVQLQPDEVTALTRARTPVVFLGDNPDLPVADRVMADDLGGSRAATLHLLSTGARRVAMITGPTGAGIERVKGYAAALTSSGLPFDPALTRDGNWLRSGGREAMHSLMTLSPRPDAVFCANDLMAIGAMDAARELGLRIPEDVVLAGFDDIEAAALVTPTLTTVVNPAYEVGQSAGRLLWDRMTAGPGAEAAQGSRSVVLPCHVVPRQSTAAVPESARDTAGAGS